MKSEILYVVALVLMTLTSSLFSQDSVQISQPDLELRDDEIVISYRILRSSNADLFKIWIEVTDDNGKSLNVKSLNGDVGQNIRGGGDKQITWEYDKDLASLEAGIYVQVFGELLNPQIEEVQSLVTDQPKPQRYTQPGPTISKQGAVLRSIAFPGWGLSALNPGTPHWLKGVAGYGAIASSVVLNRMAYENYNKYLDSSDQTEFNDFYDKAISQQNLSRISAYVAAGIWVTDIVWTLLSDPGEGRSQSLNSRKGITLSTGYEPSSQTPMIAFRYNF